MDAAHTPRIAQVWIELNTSDPEAVSALRGRARAPDGRPPPFRRCAASA